VDPLQKGHAEVSYSWPFLAAARKSPYPKDLWRETCQLKMALGSGGWVDPDLENVGSASWNIRAAPDLQSEPFEVIREHRELSLITLDAPTIIRPDDSLSFYTRVILRLLDVPRAQNNLYSWLRIMFDFCRNKPFAYFSRYRPGPRIHAIAREYGVRVVHVPLGRIPQSTLARHQSFDFMWLTRRQWDDLIERIHESKAAWTQSNTL
jgi:hypothetical protein